MTTEEKIAYLMDQYIMTRKEAIKDLHDPDGILGPEDEGSNHGSLLHSYRHRTTARQ